MSRDQWLWRSKDRDLRRSYNVNIKNNINIKINIESSRLKPLLRKAGAAVP